MKYGCLKLVVQTHENVETFRPPCSRLNNSRSKNIQMKQLICNFITPNNVSNDIKFFKIGFV